MVIKNVIFASLALVLVAPCVYAESNAGSRQATPAAVSYAANAANAPTHAQSYAMIARGGSNGEASGDLSGDVNDGPARSTKDAVRAQVVGQLRQTVRDSELAGLSDLYAHP